MGTTKMVSMPEIPRVIAVVTAETIFVNDSYKGGKNMNELQIYTNDQFGSVRVVEVNGEPWFVAADVCRALELDNVSMAVDRLDDDERGVSPIDTLGGMQRMKIVSESGLYALVLGSRKEEAKAFKRWVTHDVIPSIRKHGGYLTPEKIEEVLINPDTIIRLATDLKIAQEKRKALEAEKAALLPKAEYYDALVDRNGLMSLRDTAKLLEVGEREFIITLMERGYLYRNPKKKLMPYAAKNKGYFSVREYLNEQTGNAGIQTLVTACGRNHLLQVFGKQTA